MYILTVNINSESFETLLFRNKPTKADLLAMHLCPSRFLDDLLGARGEVQFTSRDLSEMSNSSVSFLSRYGSDFGCSDIFNIVLSQVDVIEN